MPATRLRSERRQVAQSLAIPIVNSSMCVVAWTLEPPTVLPAGLRHPEAESLLGGPVAAVYLELRNPDDVLAAGAPPDWKGPWRCLALAKQGAADRNLHRQSESMAQSAKQSQL